VCRLESAVRNCNARFTRGFAPPRSKLRGRSLTNGVSRTRVKVRPVRTRARARVRFRGRARVCARVYRTVRRKCREFERTQLSPARTCVRRSIIDKQQRQQQVELLARSEQQQASETGHIIHGWTSPKRGTRRISSRGFRFHSLEFFLAHGSTHARTHYGRRVRNLDGA